MVYLESGTFVSFRIDNCKFGRHGIKMPALHFLESLSPALAGNTDYFGNPFDRSGVAAFSGFLSGWSAGLAADCYPHSNDVLIIESRRWVSSSDHG